MLECAKAISGRYGWEVTYSSELDKMDTSMVDATTPGDASVDRECVNLRTCTGYPQARLNADRGHRQVASVAIERANRELCTEMVTASLGAVG